MTNILTWNTKFLIPVPKLNTNWLSVISLIVLCTMTFVAINAFADCCEDLEKEVENARLFVEAAANSLANAERLLKVLQADESTSQEALDLVQGQVNYAKGIHLYAKITLFLLELKLALCRLTCDDEANSGSCDSGSCG